MESLILEVDPMPAHCNNGESSSSAAEYSVVELCAVHTTRSPDSPSETKRRLVEKDILTLLPHLKHKEEKKFIIGKMLQKLEPVRLCKSSSDHEDSSSQPSCSSSTQWEEDFEIPNENPKLLECSTSDLRNEILTSCNSEKHIHSVFSDGVKCESCNSLCCVPDVVITQPEVPSRSVKDELESLLPHLKHKDKDFFIDKMCEKIHQSESSSEHFVAEVRGPSSPGQPDAVSRGDTCTNADELESNMSRTPSWDRDAFLISYFERHPRPPAGCWGRKSRCDEDYSPPGTPPYEEEVVKLLTYVKNRHAAQKTFDKMNAKLNCARTAGSFARHRVDSASRGKGSSSRQKTLTSCSEIPKFQSILCLKKSSGLRKYVSAPQLVDGTAISNSNSSEADAKLTICDGGTCGDCSATTPDKRRCRSVSFLPTTLVMTDSASTGDVIGAVESEYDDSARPLPIHEEEEEAQSSTVVPLEELMEALEDLSPGDEVGSLSEHVYWKQFLELVIDQHEVGDPVRDKAERELLALLEILPKNLWKPWGPTPDDFPVGKLKFEACGICFESQWLYRRVCCNFPSCNGCLQQYFASKIQEGIITIQCCNQNCNQYVHRNEISMRLAADMKEKFNKLLTIKNVDDRTKTCPRCNHVMVLTAVTAATLMVTARSSGLRKPTNAYGLTQERGIRVQCPECLLEWCFLCHAPWHDQQTCKQFRRGDRQLRSWAKEMNHGQLNAQKCPKCKIFIQRSSGCDHMLCSQCNTKFCYRCGDRFRRLKFFGDHYCKLSVFGCKYRYKPDKPFQRKFIRGAIFGSKVLVAPLLGSLAVSAGALAVALGLLALPLYGGVRLYRRYKYARMLHLKTTKKNGATSRFERRRPSFYDVAESEAGAEGGCVGGVDS